MKVRHRVAVVAALMSGLAFTPGVAQAEEEVYTLRASNLSTQTGGLGQMLETYAREVAEATDGRLVFEVYHSASLGPANKQHDLLRAGVADIGFISANATPGRFPKTDLLSLPNTIRNSTEAGGNTALVMQFAPEHLYEEYEDVRVLWVAAIPSSEIFTADVPVRTLEDLKGLKIRASSKAARTMLRDLGVEPITISSGEAADALQKNSIDGMHSSLGAVWALKMGEILKYRTPLLTTNGFVILAMNEDAYARLPDDLKEVIDGLGGAESAIRYSTVYQEDSQDIIDYFADKDIELITPDPELVAEVNRISDAFAEEVLSGLDDEEMRDFYRMVREADDSGS